jgi:hypothetical protein
MSITLLSLDMIFERFIVMRSFGALECRQFQHHYEGAFEGNRARNSLRCRWWHRAFVRGHLLKISSAWVLHCCLWTWFLKGLSWWDLSAPLNADSFSIIMKGLSKEIELGTHCDVADDIALLLGVTFLRSVQHEFTLLSLDMIFERFIVMRSFGALECRQFQHHYEGAFEGNRARNSLRCRWWHRAFARGHLLKISSAWV